VEKNHIEKVADVLGIDPDISLNDIAQLLSECLGHSFTKNAERLKFFHRWAESPVQNLVIALELATNKSEPSKHQIVPKPSPSTVNDCGNQISAKQRKQAKVEKKRIKKQAKKQAIKAIKAYRHLKSQNKNPRLKAAKQETKSVVRKPQPKASFHAPKVPFSFDHNFIKSNDFLLTDEWRDLRKSVVSHYGTRCMCCKRDPTPGNGLYVNVDHIKPRKTHPQLALLFDNLQVLCNICNKGKGNWDTTDWRPKK
jgi:hypothetical protein